MNNCVTCSLFNIANLKKKCNIRASLSGKVCVKNKLKCLKEVDANMVNIGGHQVKSYKLQMLKKEHCETVSKVNYSALIKSETQKIFVAKNLVRNVLKNKSISELNIDIGKSR